MSRLLLRAGRLLAHIPDTLPNRSVFAHIAECSKHEYDIATYTDKKLSLKKSDNPNHPGITFTIVSITDFEYLSSFIRRGQGRSIYF